jgi:hypothetical protein
VLARSRGYTQFRKEAVVLVDKKLRTPTDTTRVNLAEDWEVEYWCERFDVNEGTLRACIAAVGPGADDIQRRLGHAFKESFKNDGED